MTRWSWCRALVRLFPRGWRERNADALMGTLRDAAEAGDGRPSARDALDLLGCAARERTRGLAGPGLALAVLVVLLAVVSVTHAAGGAVTPAFLVTALVVTLIPGAGVVFTISTAVSGGWRDGVVAAAGCTIAIVPHVAAAVLGLSGLMQTGATAFEVVRWAGVAYLVFLGVAMIRDRGGPAIAATARGRVAAPVIVRRAVMVNLLNPKLTVFFFAFLPQFVDGRPGAADPRLAELGAVFMIVTLAGFLAYAAVASAARERLLRAPAVRLGLQRVLGAAVVGFAAHLALSER